MGRVVGGLVRQPSSQMVHIKTVMTKALSFYSWTSHARESEAFEQTISDRYVTLLVEQLITW